MEVEDPGFWRLRQATLMQYFVNMSTARANGMLITLLIDPFLNNAILYLFIKWLWVLPQADGGCCYVQSSKDVLTFYLIVYLVGHVMCAAITTVVLYNVLTEKSIPRLCLIFILALSSLHMFLMGFCPCLHRHFRIQEIGKTIGACSVRNLPIVLLQFTMIGLLLMNVTYLI